MDIIVGFLKEANINMIDYVLIENQPSNLNGIMKTINYLVTLGLQNFNQA